MRALFFPCTMDGLPWHSGSAMIRCEWVAKYWDGAEVYRGQNDLGGQDLYVFQKAYRTERIRAWIELLAQRRDEGGGLLAFDLCDPDFLDERARERMLRVLPLFDFATATTTALVDWLSQYLPAYVVPDGVDPDAITHHHAFDPTDTPSVCWIGYERNVGALEPMVQGIQALGVEPMICVIDRPVSFDHWLEILTQYDIVLNPRPDTAQYRYKSNNKSLIAWAAGVAVAETVDELRDFLVPWRREAAVMQNGAWALDTCHARNSAAIWQQIVEQEGTV